MGSELEFLAVLLEATHSTSLSFCLLIIKKRNSGLPGRLLRELEIITYNNMWESSPKMVNYSANVSYCPVSA